MSKHLGVVDPVDIEARQRRQLAGHGGRRCWSTRSRLILGGQVTAPQVDVMTLRPIGMDAELARSACPGFKVTAVGSGGVLGIAKANLVAGPIPEAGREVRPAGPESGE